MKAHKVNLHASFAKLESSLATLCDERGVPRSATIPFVEGHGMAEHIQAVSQIADAHGGLANNFLTTYHHPGGKGWDSAEGETVLHPVYKLQETLILKDDPNAIRAIGALRAMTNQVSHLLGADDGTVVQVRSQLNLIARNNAEGMNLLDFGTAVLSLAHSVIQAVAKAHAHRKRIASGGQVNHIKPLPPRHGMPQPTEDAEDFSGEEEQAPANGNSPAEAAAPANSAAGPDLSSLAKPGAVAQPAA